MEGKLNKNIIRMAAVFVCLHVKIPVLTETFYLKNKKTRRTTLVIIEKNLLCILKIVEKNLNHFVKSFSRYPCPGFFKSQKNLLLRSIFFYLTFFIITRIGQLNENIRLIH